MSARVLLIGLPGVGKSTTGRRLAKMLGVAFADSDELIETKTGQSVREIFASGGEPAFREVEAEAILAALHDFDGVLALGGGALECDSTRVAVSASGVPVVRLEASLPTLVARIGDARTRPLLSGDPEAKLAELAAQRGATYASAATLTVQTDGKAPGQVAASIASKLKSSHKVSR